MWKLLAGIIEDEIYGHLKRSSLLQNEQNVHRRVSRGTKEQLYFEELQRQDNFEELQRGKEKSSHGI